VVKIKFKGYKRPDGTRTSCTIKGTRYDPNGIYEVDEPLANWIVSKELGEKIEDEIPEVFYEEKKETPPATQKTATTNYDKILQLTEGHLAEIYGSYGCGKSRFVYATAIEAQKMLGKNVLFIDTEGGLTDRQINELKNYWYVGDEIDALEAAVREAKNRRNEFDLLIVDSVGHPIYVNYVELKGLDNKLKAYQRLAMVFRDMVRFARGERGKDMGKRKALAIAVNHPVSEFARMSHDLPPDEPLNPFGGAIHRVPKVILRIEPKKITPTESVFSLKTFKLRNMAKDVEIALFTIDKTGTRTEWKI